VWGGCLRKQAPAGWCLRNALYSSPEVRENLNGPELDEIITTNTLPRSSTATCQGRLRRKLTVLKLEKWISHHVLDYLGISTRSSGGRALHVDMSSKNPRWTAQINSVSVSGPGRQPMIGHDGSRHHLHRPPQHAPIPPGAVGAIAGTQENSINAHT